MPRLVGIGKAKELIFTAKICSGTEAAEIGLVEHVVSQNESNNAAFEKALEIAKQIADKVGLLESYCSYFHCLPKRVQ